MEKSIQKRLYRMKKLACAVLIGVAICLGGCGKEPLNNQGAVEETRDNIITSLQWKTQGFAVKDASFVIDMNAPEIKDLYDMALPMRKTRINNLIDQYMPGLSPEEAYETARDIDYMSVKYDFFMKEYFLFGFSSKTMEERKAFIPIKHNIGLIAKGKREQIKIQSGIVS